MNVLIHKYFEWSIVLLVFTLLLPLAWMNKGVVGLHHGHVVSWSRWREAVVGSVCLFQFPTFRVLSLVLGCFVWGEGVAQCYEHKLARALPEVL